VIGKRSRSWLPAWAACKAPVAFWLADTSEVMALELVGILPTTPA
jgi:hypothetical protein